MSTLPTAPPVPPVLPGPPLPPVEQVRPGLWSIPVPLPVNSLRYVLVYLFETPRGGYVVDAGWNTDEAWTSLSRGLAVAGYAVADVRGVLATHVHADHYGLAGRIRDAGGAWVGLHPADAALVDQYHQRPEEILAGLTVALRDAGAPADEIARLGEAAGSLRGLGDAVRPDVLVEDGDRPDVPGWDLTAIWTPGHSPGHLCFAAPRAGVVLTGDHVLPRITPHISAHPGSPEDPLGDYLASLDAIAAHDDGGIVLPAHEHRFTGLAPRAAALRAHHEERLREVRDIVAAGARTTWEVASGMEWKRPWEVADVMMRRAAVGEALAHLHTLERRGLLVRNGDQGPARWSECPAVPSTEH